MAASHPHHDYWDTFYASRASSAVPEEPSAFAHWVGGLLHEGQLVVEVGFGTARDAFWFVGRGNPVAGFDFAESAVQRARGHADGQGVSASFSMLDLYDTTAVDVVAEEISRMTDRPAVYGRFLIHSLEEAGRLNLLDLAAKTLSNGGDLYLEFRTGQDRETEHLFGEDHFRVYLDPARVAGEIEERGGTVTHCEAGHGFAVYKSEDPHVARISARWSA